MITIILLQIQLSAVNIAIGVSSIGVFTGIGFKIHSNINKRFDKKANKSEITDIHEKINRKADKVCIQRI